MASRYLLTKITHCVANWPCYRLPWLILALSASALVAVALYTQHGPQQLIPCVQCIYQRTFMITLAGFAWVGTLAPRVPVVRWAALAGWLASSLAGLATARHHVWLQEAANPLFQPCSPYPDFPAWMPLHEWLPAVFGAGGLCGDIDWEFMGMSMPEWLRVIFALYLLLAVLVTLCHLLAPRLRQRLNR